MGTVSKNYTFASGATIFASEINSNFDTLYNLVNGNLDNDNLDTNAAISGSKVDLSAPGPIGGTTPSTMAVTTLAVSGNMTLSGALQTGLIAAESAGPTTAANQGAYYVYNNGAESRPYFKTESDGDAYEIPVIGTDGYLNDEVVDTSALKTTQGEVSVTNVAFIQATLPGGEYAFRSQYKVVGGGSMSARLITSRSIGSTYVNQIELTATAGSTAYARERYVTASGLDHWIFIMENKDGTLNWWKASDHPSYGNDLSVSQPFLGRDDENIYCIHKDSAEAVKRLDLQTVQTEYEIGEEAEYVPMHQGSFIIKDGQRVPVMIGELPDYVKCVKLNKKAV